MNWQSWSPVRTPLIKIPIRNFPPVRLIAQSNKRPLNFTKSPLISGACTWYRFGKNITPSKILSFAKSSKSLHPEIDYCLIDDGWCRWGDWQQPKFNLKSISQKLEKINLKTGLWLAPFLASQNSELFKKHPNSFIRNSRGQLVNGLQFTHFDHLFGNQKYIIDFSSPLAKKYIYDSISLAIEKWGVTLLKLDFLYAPYFDPALKDDHLPHRYLSELFKWIKQTYPQVYLMACGCPFAPAKYLVDSIRISDDITVPFLYHQPLLKKIIHHRQINLLIEKWRSCQHLAKYFHLDPDVSPSQKLSGFSDSKMKHLTRIFDESFVKFYG